MYRGLKPLVLGSASPRRRDLLALTGARFRVEAAKAAEPAPDAGEAPEEFARRSALIKTRDVAARNRDEWVLGADTSVVLEGHIMGKPWDEIEALRMLGELSGREHEVVTGCALLGPGGESELFVAVTRVCMVRITPEVARAYVATGEPMDKAGAYGIQGMGGCLVAGIRGSYTNVVGLPLAEVVGVLESRGVIAPRQG
jgi:septum formation protein